jgi:hypothetical protein
VSAAGPAPLPGGAGLPLVDYLPIATTLIAAAFSTALFRRYRERRSGPHLLWWAAGVLVYGIGTLTEASTTLFGWHEWLFRAWYISGALMGGAPLAQGTAYLLLARRTADRLAAALVAAIGVAAAFALLNPVDYAAVQPHRLTGAVFAWPWARAFSPFINLYAFVLLVGGAALSAWRFSRKTATRNRFIGNVCIAVGALLPGIGGTATRFGHTEVLYVTELLGLILIYAGYRLATAKGAAMRDEAAVQLRDAELRGVTR